MNPTRVPLSSLELFSLFYLIVSFFWPTTLLFWFSFTALINVVSCSRKLFHEKSSATLIVHYLASTKQQTDAVKEAEHIGVLRNKRV